MLSFPSVTQAGRQALFAGVRAMDTWGRDSLPVSRRRARVARLDDDERFLNFASLHFNSGTKICRARAFDQPGRSISLPTSSWWTR
jgi:hypothetical protein